MILCVEDRLEEEAPEEADTTGADEGEVSVIVGVAATTPVIPSAAMAVLRALVSVSAVVSISLDPLETETVYEILTRSASNDLICLLAFLVALVTLTVAVIDLRNNAAAIPFSTFCLKVSISMLSVGKIVPDNI
jgi:hypothetical protein